MSDITLGGYRSGAIGRVTELHATYYHEHWGFDMFFEAKVAIEMAEFLNRFDAVRDGFWAAMVDGAIVGSVAIDGREAETRGARLHRFIVAPEYHGRGIGKLLLREAIEFCKRARYRRVFLTTFAGLDAARHLYEQWGFRLCEEDQGCTWLVPGRTVTEQTFELIL